MAQYDLTSVLAQHLDRHLVFPLLEFLGSKGTYAEKDIEAAKLALIEKTNMVDYAVDIYQQLNQTDEVSQRNGQLVAGGRPQPSQPPVGRTALLLLLLCLACAGEEGGRQSCCAAAPSSVCNLCVPTSSGSEGASSAHRTHTIAASSLATLRSAAAGA
jgi:hypothetical protein